MFRLYMANSKRIHFRETFKAYIKISDGGDSHNYDNGSWAYWDKEFIYGPEVYLQIDFGTTVSYACVVKTKSIINSDNGGNHNYGVDEKSNYDGGENYN